MQRIRREVDTGKLRIGSEYIDPTIAAPIKRHLESWETLTSEQPSLPNIGDWAVVVACFLAGLFLIAQACGAFA